jgi:hypothetical protein
LTLGQRIKTYLEKLPELLPEHEGKYALIRDGEIAVYDSLSQATEIGCQKYGSLNEFLVLKIEP